MSELGLAKYQILYNLKRSKTRMNLHSNHYLNSNLIYIPIQNH